MLEFPMVSIVIITHNNKRLLKRYLESVVNTEYPNFEIIVVDNASSDGTSELVHAFAKTDSRIRLVKNPINNYEVGLNLGIKESKGKYVAKIDDDTWVEPSWLKEPIKVMEQDQSIASVQSVALTYNQNKSSGDYGKYFGHDMDYLGLFYPKPPTNKVVDIFFPIFFSVIIRKECLDKIGKFDPEYFIYFEEVDFGWKARLLGYKNVLVPSSLVHHLGPKKGLRKFDIYHARKNHIVTLLANYSFMNAVKYSLLYITLLVLGSCYDLLFNRDLRLFINTSRALLWDLRHIRYIYTKRCSVQRFIRKVSDKQIMRYMIKPRLSFRSLKKGI